MRGCPCAGAGCIACRYHADAQMAIMSLALPNLAVDVLQALPCQPALPLSAACAPRTPSRAHGVVVSHPLSMREALGSIPSVSNASFCMHGGQTLPAPLLADVGPRSVNVCSGWPHTPRRRPYLLTEQPPPLQPQARCSPASASAGNRTRVTSMATMYSATRPLMQCSGA